MENRKFEKWTQNDYNNIIQMYNTGMSYSEIANKIGRTAKSVRIKLNNRGFFQSKRSKEARKYDVYEKIICLNCNKEFEAYKRNKQNFCSHSCSACYNNKTRIINTGKEKDATCINCGEKIKINIYASLKSASCLKCNPNYGKERNKYTKDVEKVNGKFICLNCGKELKKRGKYCSRNCQKEFKNKELFKKIESGDFSMAERNYKNYLIYKYGEKCMQCGWKEINSFSHKIPIELHHIDGNPDNNELQNLNLLCPNCHSLQKNWKSLNSGNGRYSKRREKRNKRYKDGKSS
jgi:5-methylcytosine-specific restriction endonuclease McrA